MKQEGARDPRSTNHLDELLGDDVIGLEGRAAVTDHARVKTWLRLVSCTAQIEAEVRRRLRLRFQTTLPRFHYLAQLHRSGTDHPGGLRMSALSRYLMVTGGNVTVLTGELEKGGYVIRQVDLEDRRSARVALTPRGKRAFEDMAAAHETWIVELLDGLQGGEGEQLHALLGHLRLSLARRLEIPDKAG